MKPTNLSKEDILDASIQLFQQRGFANLGMRQIAECLHIKAPSLYHHFPSKEALAKEAISKYRLIQLNKLQLIDAKQGLLTRLNAYADLFADMLQDGDKACLYLVMFPDPTLRESQCGVELRLFAKQNTGWLSKTLWDFQPDLADRVASSVDKYAEFIFATFEGLMLLSLGEKQPAKFFRDKAADFLLFQLSIVSRVKQS